jgi:prepilin-type N-terminal cleavage/methylation domain-containing protein
MVFSKSASAAPGSQASTPSRSSGRLRDSSAKPASKVSGFTLIELMVTVVLVGILALTALPMTSNWILETRLAQTQSELQQAIALARAAAMRNPKGFVSSKPVAVVCFIDNKQLEVRLVKNDSYAGDYCAAAALPAAAETLWQTALKSTVELTQANTTLSYIQFDTRGRLVSSNCPQANKCADPSSDDNKRIVIKPKDTSLKSAEDGEFSVNPF